MTVRRLGCALLVLLLLGLAQALTFHWPIIRSTTRQEVTKKLTSSFCAYRSSHLHGGYDIPTNESNHNDMVVTLAPVNKVLTCFLSQGGDGWIVTLRHYDTALIYIDSVTTDTTLLPAGGSRYVHLDVPQAPIHTVGAFLGSDTGICRAESCWFGHLHFEIRDSGPTSYLDDQLLSSWYNPAFFIGPDIPSDNLSVADPTPPTLYYLWAGYGYGVGRGSAPVNQDWVMSGMPDFSTYLTDTTDTATFAFVRCLLPAESKADDEDDPHLVMRKGDSLRFIVSCKDTLDSHGGYGVPYTVQLLEDENVQEPSPVVDSAYYAVRFDSLRHNGSVCEYYYEHVIYHETPPGGNGNEERKRGTLPSFLAERKRGTLPSFLAGIVSRGDE
jgi:hypothetical protein